MTEQQPLYSFDSDPRSFQELFDTAVDAMATQGWRQSRTDDLSVCAYAGKNGMCCAVGALLPPEVRSKIDNKDLASLIIKKQLVINSHVLNLLWELQGAHDKGQTKDDMIYRFWAVANRLGLKTDNINKYLGKDAGRIFRGTNG